MRSGMLEVTALGAFVAYFTRRMPAKRPIRSWPHSRQQSTKWEKGKRNAAASLVRSSYEISPVVSYRSIQSGWIPERLDSVPRSQVRSWHAA